MDEKKAPVAGGFSVDEPEEHLEIAYSIILTLACDDVEHVDGESPDGEEWECTESYDLEEGEENDYGYRCLRKHVAVLNQEQFNNFIRCHDLCYECETMGAIGTPAFGDSLVGALSFDGSTGDFPATYINAYVTPFYPGKEPESHTPEDWRRLSGLLKKT